MKNLIKALKGTNHWPPWYVLFMKFIHTIKTEKTGVRTDTFFITNVKIVNEWIIVL